MAYAVVSAHSGAAKTTVSIGGVSYDVYEFASVGGGSIEFSSAGDVDYLIVGGGGAGNIAEYEGGGGGGAGGMLAGTVAVTTGLQSVVVGRGGVRVTKDTMRGSAESGGNSSALGLTAIGGGAGATRTNADLAAKSGGSGGGAARDNPALYGRGTPGQGHDGGTWTGSSTYVGGGGGAGGPGFPSDQQGRGGPGLPSTITGATVYYAGGGTGGGELAISGGIGGGGGVANSFGLDGANGKGGGGGGGHRTYDGVARTSGAGGSGIVILRVATPPAVTIPGPGKLDLANALQIKTASGEWLEAKGPGWHWVRPAL